jgi:hypothetical protein
MQEKKAEKAPYVLAILMAVVVPQFDTARIA